MAAVDTTRTVRPSLVVLRSPSPSIPFSTRRSSTWTERVRSPQLFVQSCLLGLHEPSLWCLRRMSSSLLNGVHAEDYNRMLMSTA